MIDDRCSDVAMTRNDVDNARWQIACLNDFGQFDCGQRRGFSRFQNDRIAGCQRWSNFPGCHQQGKIPGDDWPGNTQRFGCAIGKREIQLVGPTGVIKKVRRRKRNINVARFANRFAAVERFDHGQLAGSFLDQCERFGKYISRSRCLAFWTTYLS